jgi:hypothetical protein
MHARPFFWFLFTLTCMSLLLFAALHHPHVPGVLEVHVGQQHLTTRSFATLELHVTDPQGFPIEEATISSYAQMTNMSMPPTETHIMSLGKGKYIVQLRLNMAGPWTITVNAQARGFVTLSRTLSVQVDQVL